jgi:PAS domain S-box-containing protein
MKLFRAYQKEIRELRFSLLMAFLLIGYTVSIFGIDSFRHFLDPALQNSMMSTAINCLVLWLCITILISYLSYSKISMDTRELHSILEGMGNDAVLVVSPDRKIMMCNEAVKNLFGYTPEEIMKKETSVLYKDRRPAKGSMGIGEQLERLGFHAGFAVGIRKDKSEFPLEIITGNLRGRPGAVLQIRVVAEQDLSPQPNQADSELVEELESSLKRLKDLEDSREALAQMVVHDMKTPLQVVIGNLEILEKALAGGQDIPDAEMATNALTQSRRLVGMIDSILQVSRLESGAIRLNPQPVDLRELITTCVDEARTMLDGRSIALDLPEERLPVHVDVDILRRVIQNLISNSVKHGGEGADISLRVEDSHGCACFSISDNGPGIPAEYCDQIFEKYTRLQTKQTKGQISTGLGLPFCKLAIESHQGTISLKSKPGEGSTFSFSLPLVSSLVSAG